MIQPVFEQEGTGPAPLARHLPGRLVIVSTTWEGNEVVPSSRLRGSQGEELPKRVQDALRLGELRRR